MSPVAKLVAWVIGGVVLIGILLLINPFVEVGAGERAVITHFGSVSGEIGSGLHFITPITTTAHIINVQTQKEATKASAASSDLQQVTAEIAVNYNVDPNKVADLYTRIGDDYQGKVIDPAIQEVVKAVTANYTAEELITKRAQVTKDIEDALAQKLQPQDIVVSSVNVTNFDFSDQFNQAVEAKVTAQQNALAAQNKLAQVQYEAQQTVAKAQADAEAIKIQAEAINAQGGADYVELQRIKAWDGHGCTSYCGVSASTGLLVTAK